MQVLATVFLASEEKPFKILPEWGEVIWGSIAFFVLLVLLAKFAFPAMKEALQKRSDTIQGDLQRAEEAKLEAEQVLAEYRQQLAEARQEAGKIIEEARKTADEMKKELHAKAQGEAAEIVEAAKRDLDAMVSQVKADLRRQMAEQSVDLAGRIIGKELDAAAQSDLIDEFVTELDSMGAPS